MNQNGNISYADEENYSIVSENIDIWPGEFPFKAGDKFPTDRVRERASISKTNRMLFNNDYSAIASSLLDVIPEIDPMYGYQIKQIVADIPYFKTIVDAFVSLCCSPAPIIDTPDSVDYKLSEIIGDSNLLSTLEYRIRSIFMDVIDVYVVKKDNQGKPIIQSIPVKNCIIYNDNSDVNSIYDIEIFNISNNKVEFIDYYYDGRIEKRTFEYVNGKIGEMIGDIETTLAFNGKYKVSPAGFIKHNVEHPGDTYGVDQFRYWDASIVSVCRSFMNLFRLNEKCREIIRKIPESSLTRTSGGTYAFVNKGTVTYSDGIEKDQRPDIEYVIPQLKDNIESAIQALDKATKMVSSSSGLSPIWFDFEKLGSNLSAKSIKAAMVPTALKANMICDSMTSAIQDIVMKLALMYDIQINRSDINVTWFDGITDDLEDVEYINRRLENNTMSHEDALVYLDHVSRRVAREQIAKIAGNVKKDENAVDNKEQAGSPAFNDINISNLSNVETSGESETGKNDNVVPDYQMPLVP